MDRRDRAEGGVLAVGEQTGERGVLGQARDRPGGVPPRRVDGRGDDAQHQEHGRERAERGGGEQLLQLVGQAFGRQREHDEQVAEADRDRAVQDRGEPPGRVQVEDRLLVRACTSHRRSVLVGGQV
ncbi:MAG: hypothetical protein ACR2GH_00640 [Pseudonocardia sp.]